MPFFSMFRPGRIAHAGLRVMFPVVAMVALLVAAKASPAADEKPEEPTEVAAPEDITLVTRDFVQLKCTWYAGPLGKKSIPVLMIHGWEGQRSDYEGLALALQKRGCAVLVPDLRGHGGSLRQKEPGADEKTLKRDQFKAADFQAMIDNDLDACKKFLTEKNNLGELNIELLCLVGTELGGFLATSYAERDWNWDQLPAFKIGQDVRGVVLIAPLFTFRGMTLQKTLQHSIFKKGLSLMFICGAKDTKGLSETNRVYNAVAKFHPLPKTAEEQKKNQDLFNMKPETSLPGPKLIKEGGLGVDQLIAGFIALRFTAKQEDYPWKDRPSPTGN